MARAIDLAKLGQGKTLPNPIVGAILTENDHVIGEGWHQKAGGPHAEVFALERAIRHERLLSGGRVLYTTLEPCSTWGRTPPCTNAILRAGIGRVVIATIDPNPVHEGRGVALLRAQGIEVEIGLLEDEARELNAELHLAYVPRSKVG